MQTTYYTTRNFIRHSGKVVDLSEYRRRLERVSYADVKPMPSPATAKTAPRATGRRGLGLTLDYVASLAIVVMALTVSLTFFCIL